MKTALALAACLLAASFTTNAADASAGQTLFTARCGMCHQTIGMAVGLLARRPGDTSKGLLEQRTDLSAEFVKVVVRVGTGNMPRISRAEVSDDQLKAISTYLSRGKP